MTPQLAREKPNSNTGDDATAANEDFKEDSKDDTRKDSIEDPDTVDDPEELKRLAARWSRDREKGSGAFHPAHQIEIDRAVNELESFGRSVPIN